MNKKAWLIENICCLNWPACFWDSDMNSKIPIKIFYWWTTKHPFVLFIMTLATCWTPPRMRIHFTCIPAQIRWWINSNMMLWLMMMRQSRRKRSCDSYLPMFAVMMTVLFNRVIKIRFITCVCICGRKTVCTQKHTALTYECMSLFFALLHWLFCLCSEIK